MWGGMDDYARPLEGKQCPWTFNSAILTGPIYRVEPARRKLSVSSCGADREFPDLTEALNFFRANLIDDICGADHLPVMTNFLSYGKTRQSACDKKPVIYPSGMEKPYADQAARILWHRNLLGLTQTEYAQKAGLKRAAINNYESGDFPVGLAAGRALRRTYGLSLDFIYEGSEDALPMNLRNALLDSPIDR